MASGSAEMLLMHIRAEKLPEPELEFRFHKTRRWRSDLAWQSCKLLVEFEGGVYSNGRHVRGRGYENDCEKYNAATLLGYQILRFTAKHVKSGYAIDTIKAALGKAANVAGPV